MSRLGLTARDRRALLVGAVAILPGVLFRFAVMPYWHALAEARGRIESERELLARERGLRVEAAFLPAAMREDQMQFSTVAPRLFGGTDPTLVAADVQDYLDEAASAARFRLDQMETEPPRPIEGGLLAVALVIRGQTDFPGMLTLLRRLAEGPRLVRVGRLLVEATSPGTSGVAEPEVLSVTMRVEGFMLGPDAATQAQAPGRVAGGRALPSAVSSHPAPTSGVAGAR